MNTTIRKITRWPLAAAAMALLAMTAVSSAQSDATLSNLVPSAGTLDPTISSGTIGYTATVSYATGSMTLTPTATDPVLPTIKVTVNADPPVTVASGVASGPLLLSVGPNTITTEVVSQDSSATMTYTLTVTRTAPSTNADLSDLVPNAGTLTPAFDGTTSYTATVPYATSTIKITPTAADSLATIKVNGNTVTSGSQSSAIPLLVGDTVITTVVTAEDPDPLILPKTYTLTVTRTAASTNANLSDLVSSVGTLTPVFDGSTSYTASVPYPASSITVTPTAADPLATIRVNGVTVASGNASGPISLSPGANIITTVVKAEDASAKTYTLTVTVTVADPVAIPGGPYGAAVGGSLVLNGSASLASDGHAITLYEWDLNNNGDFADNPVTGATPAAIPYATLTGTYGMALGTNTIGLKVTDSAAKTATATVTVNLIAPVTGTWTLVSNGNWSATANWSGGIIPTTLGDTANLTANLSGNRTVTIDTTSRTVGTLNLGDSGSTYYAYTLASTGSALLTFDNNKSTAQLNQTSTGVGATLNNTLGVRLNDSLAIGNNSAVTTAASNYLTVAGTVSSTAPGTKTLSNVGTGGGLVTISGAISNGTGTVAIFQNSATSPMLLSGNNSYTGGNTVNAGTLTLSGTSTGTGATKVNGGTMTFLKKASLYNNTSASWIPESIIVASGGTLGLGVGASASGYFDITDIDTFLDGSHMGASTASIGLKPGAILGLDTTAGNFTFSSTLGDLSGGNVLNVAKLGANTLTLTGTNSYTGTTTAKAGNLVVGTPASLPGYNVPNKVVFDGGTIGVDLANWSSTQISDLLANATKTSGAFGIDTTSGSATQFAPFSTSNLGPLGMAKIGTNTLTLDQANTYTGPTLLSGGTLKLANAGAISSSSGLLVNGGSVVLDTAVSLKAMTFNVAANSSVSGGTLNFSAGGSINQYYNTYDATITSQITGSPTINVNRGPVGNSYIGFVFAPASGTQTLGVINLPADLGGVNDKAGVTLGGSTTGNTVTSISYANSLWGYSTVNKTGSSTWTVGNVDTGTININGGTLIVNGTAKCMYNTLTVNIGGRLTGAATLFKNDRRGIMLIKSGGIVAPGNSVGTMTFQWGTVGTPTAVQQFTQFETGAIYEWEVGPANATDKVHIFDGKLQLGGFALKILDAGGEPLATDKLPVFSYDPAKVTVRTLSLGSVTFDTSALGAGWSFGSLSLVDDGAGIIYLTGLSKTAGGYASWKTANSTTGGINEDHDGDGVPNGIEYFLGGPTGNTTGFTALPGVVNTAGVLSVTWIKAASYTGNYPAGFVVETSNTLAAGSWVTAATSVTPAIADTVYIDGNNVTYTFPAGSTKFARLRVTGP